MLTNVSIHWSRKVFQSTQSVSSLLAKPQTIYCGFDPTAESLHIGSLLPLSVLKHLSDEGHNVIALIGTATGQIGDPSGRSSERTLLDKSQVAMNAQKIAAQIKALVPKAQIVENGLWFNDMGFLEFLRNTGKHFSLNQMLALESVKSRQESGISYTEFSYSLMQAYDFYELNKRFGCTTQIGGSDQWGNMTMGTQLVRKLTGQNVDVLTFPLLMRANGQKFGKSADGNIWLDPDKTRPEQLVDYLHQLEDKEAQTLTALLTNLSADEIDKLAAQPSNNRAFQNHLVKTLLNWVHPTKQLALDVHSLKFERKQMDKLSRSQLEKMEQQSPVVQVDLDKGLAIVPLLVSVGLCKSKTEARRMLTQGAIYLNGHTVKEETTIVSSKHQLDGYAALLGCGKQNWVILKPTPRQIQTPDI